jgi:hypothetical protein
LDNRGIATDEPLEAMGLGKSYQVSQHFRMMWELSVVF